MSVWGSQGHMRHLPEVLRRFKHTVCAHSSELRLKRKGHAKLASPPERSSCRRARCFTLQSHRIVPVAVERQPPRGRRRHCSR